VKAWPYVIAADHALREFSEAFAVIDDRIGKSLRDRGRGLAM
jgi:hypothetical protein